jgi:prepilin-type processing-associated H-X9-DG protein
MNKISLQSGFSLVELFALIAVLLLVAYFAVPSGDTGKTKSARLQCFNNLKSVGLAARIYATDNNGLMPGAYFLSNKIDLATIDTASCFRIFSNQLSTPKILVCPSDSRAQATASFTNLTTKNISYFLSLTAHETSPQCFLAGDRNIQTSNSQATIPPGLFPLTTNLQLSWSKELHHEQGNIAMVDGSVQEFSSARLNRYLREHAVSTNLLIFP